MTAPTKDDRRIFASAEKTERELRREGFEKIRVDLDKDDRPCLVVGKWGLVR